GGTPARTIGRGGPDGTGPRDRRSHRVDPRPPRRSADGGDPGRRDRLVTAPPAPAGARAVGYHADASGDPPADGPGRTAAARHRPHGGPDRRPGGLRRPAALLPPLPGGHRALPLCGAPLSGASGGSSAAGPPFAGRPAVERTAAVVRPARLRARRPAGTPQTPGTRRRAAPPRRPPRRPAPAPYR